VPDNSEHAEIMQTTQRGRVRVEQGHKRVRAMLAGEILVDTIRPTFVWEVPYFPMYYMPREDVRVELVPTGQTSHSPSRGNAEIFDVKLAGQTLAGAAISYPDPEIPELRGLVRFEWDVMDQWFEEDEEIIGHPRDPYSRVDILASSRHVQVEVDGQIVADSVHPRLLFETGLPVRYYLPKTDVRMDLLSPTDTHSVCPYKGIASYYSLTVNGARHEDLVWWYPTPLPECQKVIGLACFYNEKVDLVVDGQRLERPHTKFS
jgi:uncharacterized protein (DUF427 family)